MTGLVIGAVLAFSGSTYAAVLVKRYEAREAARARIHTELLPPLWRTVLSETRSTEQHDKLSDALNELRWAAAIAGSTETEFAQRLNAVASKWQQELDDRERERVRAASQPEYRQPATDNDEESEEDLAVRLSNSFNQTCSEFSQYLEKRLRRAWWEPF